MAPRASSRSRSSPGARAGLPAAGVGVVRFTSPRDAAPTQERRARLMAPRLIHRSHLPRKSGMDARGHSRVIGCNIFTPTTSRCGDSLHAESHHGRECARVGPGAACPRARHGTDRRCGPSGLEPPTFRQARLYGHVAEAEDAPAPRQRAERPCPVSRMGARAHYRTGQLSRMNNVSMYLGNR